MPKLDKKIGVISTFLQQLDALSEQGNKQYYFRGHSKKSFLIEPSIYRNDGLVQNEARMLKELILRCPNDFADGLTTFECLVKMQHYGLPTRLLDITSNPLVALYFACEIHETGDEDGEIIVFDFDVEEVKYFDSDTVSLVAHLSRQPASFTLPDVLENNDPDSEEFIKRFNNDHQVKQLIHDIRADKPHFSPNIIRADIERVVCVKPRLDNPRIIRQEGAFLLFGCRKTKKQSAELEESAIVARLAVNREKKASLLRQLETLGISQATLFPEIDRVSKHIKDSYSIQPDLTIDVPKLGSKQTIVFRALRKLGEGSTEEIAESAGIKVESANRALLNLKKKKVVEVKGNRLKRRWRLPDRLNIIDKS